MMIREYKLRIKELLDIAERERDKVSKGRLLGYSDDLIRMVTELLQEVVADNNASLYDKMKTAESLGYVLSEPYRFVLTRNYLLAPEHRKCSNYNTRIACVLWQAERMAISDVAPFIGRIEEEIERERKKGEFTEHLMGQLNHLKNRLESSSSHDGQDDVFDRIEKLKEDAATAMGNPNLIGFPQDILERAQSLRDEVGCSNHSDFTKQAALELLDTQALADEVAHCGNLVRSGITPSGIFTARDPHISYDRDLVEERLAQALERIFGSLSLKCSAEGDELGMRTLEYHKPGIEAICSRFRNKGK